MEATVALGGNPNSGKTTLFNGLTGSRQHVGNYPGVTVDKKEGIYAYNGYKMHIVDLPGTYSLTAYSEEEVVARDFLVSEKPEVTIDIVDASNLERNLYLTVQLLELGVPSCVALNMMDVAKNRGIEIDTKKLSDLLAVPVLPVIARTGQGRQELMDSAAEVAKTKQKQEPLEISYGQDLDGVIRQMQDDIEKNRFMTECYPSRWIAIKYLENDEQILKKGQEANPSLAARLEKKVEKISHHLQRTLDTYPEAMIADYRYGYISSLLRQDDVFHQKYDKNRLYVSDKIDRVLTNRFMGPIIMLLILMGLYHFTFTYSETPVGWTENFFGWLADTVSANLPDGLLQSLIVSGIIDGVGGVMGFAPLIMFMFFGIALLEDSGYLARVAFMLDRVFKMFGLHGSSVMAYIVSGGIAGGCAVPGVMATRTLRSPRERLATLLTAPFMNCGAKLPVFALLIAAFFSENEAMMMFILTLIAWGGALIVAKILRLTIIKGEATPFVMELPPYRLPTFKGLMIHTWELTWQYIKKAGTIILGISVLLWAMMTFPGLPESETEKFEGKREAVKAAVSGSVVQELEFADQDTQLSLDALALTQQLSEIDAQESETALRYSAAGRIGTALESVTKLAGFDWRTNIALVGGFAAKEVVVSTLGTAYSLGEVDPEEYTSLAQRLAASPNWNPLVAISLMIFTVFYAPCFVAVVCIAKEAGSWKWGAFSMIFNTALAFGLSVLVFQIGSLI
ncbi:ferrous iron transport protein B [Desulfonema magnum]|uniref:Ferrous iron transport protein B n=1 Tax=Desulfonema magnum TaxID=45655 RepID=A0A975GML0_9BACT|nr:ferrous iron transport protein B [Desulfonema magnum]QTA87011.1 Ferrous iron transport protein B [Desulfonema magnum]